MLDKQTFPLVQKVQYSTMFWSPRFREMKNSVRQHFLIFRSKVRLPFYTKVGVYAAVFDFFDFFKIAKLLYTTLHYIIFFHISRWITNLVARRIPPCFSVHFRQNSLFHTIHNLNFLAIDFETPNIPFDISIQGHIQLSNGNNQKLTGTVI